MIYFNQLNQFDMNLKDQIKNFVKDKNGIDLNYFKKPKKSFNQLYRKCMKKLFCFNSLWSKRNIFFPKTYNNIENKSIKIKYKQINYYTKNFQFPYFYPILEYKRYLPKFKSFKGELFKDNENIILEYNFKLNRNEKALDIIQKLISVFNESSKKIYEKCCLVKNTHHSFGKLFLFKKDNDESINKFSLIFKTNKKEKEEKKSCNKRGNNKNNEVINHNEIKKDQNTTKIVLNMEDDYSNHLCYGAIFSFSEEKRNIVINSKNILFLLIRIYYHRLSAIEIFTINKSYYFNFHNSLEINNLKANKILNEFINNSSFKEIKLFKNDALILGYYNIKYKPYLFPLFEDEINIWNKKVNYFCNYDILTLINIFSNRSFRDIFQYPIFPTLYDSIGKKRELDKHIGLQDITVESLKRKELFILNYEDKLEVKDIEEEIILFNIHYSNPAYVCNYLLRVFPYSFLCIELQGDGFDAPNRLFYSIESALENSINMMTDLREMIPELYYMIELFYNKNNIYFNKLSNGRAIDNIYIKDDENIESDIKKKENYSKFLFEMRKGLESEKNINKWIDLIFGIKQKNFEDEDGNKYPYYEKCSEIDFNNGNSIFEDKIVMEKAIFGLLPYQLFNKEFPKITIKNNKILKELNLLNEELFIDEHIKINHRKYTFMCKGRILIDENYIKIIESNKKINIISYYYNQKNNNSKNYNLIGFNNDLFKCYFGEFNFENEKRNKCKYKDKMSLVNFYFLGDIFGNVSISSLKVIKKRDNEKDQNSSFFKNITLKESNSPRLHLEIINNLFDHTKEIKYIDFNSRLNILLTYSLDNFINIYIFPKLKLINVIDTNEFKDEKDINYFDEVVLLSFPFPSIICHNKEFIYMISINGELIKYEKLEEGNKIIFSIDKNLGIVEDKVEIIKNEKSKSETVFNFF